MIRILTYPDPYKISSNNFWTEICDLPWFCSSQVQANAITRIYKREMKDHQVSTISNLCNAFYPDWDNTVSSVQIQVFIDYYLDQVIPSSGISEDEITRVQEVVMANLDDLTEALKTVVNLQIHPRDLQSCPLNPDQELFLNIYETLLSSELFEKYFTEQASDSWPRVILEALQENPELQSPDLKSIASKKGIVFVGLHQFTPLILRLINHLKHEYELYFLFNYQECYSKSYQTWLDVYQAVGKDDVQITKGIASISNPSDSLGEKLGNLCQGTVTPDLFISNCEVTEFDSLISFANYVASIFREAKHINHEHPLASMKEKFYAAELDVNQILRVYFPEQFSEREFFRYPIGQFVRGLADLWNIEKNIVELNGLESIKAILNSGLIFEEHCGDLSRTLNTLEPYVEKATSLTELLEIIKDLAEKKRDPALEAHVAYLQISHEQLEQLRKGLEDVLVLAEEFFKDFDQYDNFKNFYSKLNLFLKNELESREYLTEELKKTLIRVIDRLDYMKGAVSSGSFNALKKTMALYLDEEVLEKNSANWIVKGFPQIEGDILQSKFDEPDVIYHFACLSNENLISDQKLFPWPLNTLLLESLQKSPSLKWIVSIYHKSKIEKNNYYQFILFYGLLFNRARFRLSFIRNKDKKVHSPYYLFDLLNIPVEVQDPVELGHWSIVTPNIFVENESLKPMNIEDVVRYKICPFRFQLETNIEGTFFYKTRFLITQYAQTVIASNLNKQEPASKYPTRRRTRSWNQDKSDSDGFNHIPAEQRQLLPAMTQGEKIDFWNYVQSKKSAMAKSRKGNYADLQQSGLILEKNMLDPEQLADLHQLEADELKDLYTLEDRLNMEVKPRPAGHCMYCPNKEICLEFYIQK